MAKTISELRNQSIQVRDASAAGENTATRVGTVLNDIVGHIEDYENTQSSNNSSQDAKIEGVKSSLNAEIARAKTEESNLTTQIDTERTERQAAVSREETARIQADNDEKTARMAADNAEQDARIKADNDEKTARENADITLRSMIQTEVSNRQIAVKQEEIRAMAAEKANTQAIEDETARATTAEAAETARAKAEEERLQDEIDNTNTNVGTLENKVNSNHDHLTDEVARLDLTDNEIKADIEAETARAKAAEEANAIAISEEKAAIICTDRIADGAVTIEKLADNAFDDKPIAGSNNLVKSGGVADKVAELESIYVPNCPFIKEIYINEVGVSVGLSRVNNVYASGTSYYIAFAGIPGTGFKGYTKIESSVENAKGILPIYETPEGTGSIRGYIIVDWDKLEGDVSPSAYLNNKAYNVEYSPSIKVFLTKANEIREVELLANSNKKRLDNIDDYRLMIDYSKFGLSQGLISASDGSINSSFEGTEVTGYVKVKQGDEIIYSGHSSSSGWSALAGYSDNQGNGFVSLILGETTNIIERKVVVPSGVNYVRAAARNSQSPGYAGVDLKLEVYRETNNPRFADYPTQEKVNGLTHYRILMVGNSYAIDASAYAPFIMKTIGAKFKLTIGVVYYAGCDLSSHVNFITNDSAVYGYVKYDPAIGIWNNTTNVKFSNIAKDERWDIVTLQQSSAATPDITTYANHINTLMNLCSSKIGHNVKFGWLMGQARNDVDGTTTQYFNKQVNIVNSKVLTYPINFVIPVSTAVQNARITRLSNDVEDFASGIQGGHMREGLARQLSAYSFILALSEYLGYNIGIIGDTTRCNALWTQGKGLFNQLGTNVGINDANVLLIQKCAELASTNKMEIKDCTIFQ